MNHLSRWAEAIAAAVEQTVRDRFCHPTATYRLQLAGNSLTFCQAVAVVPYLDALGVSHIYSSPCLKTRRGTTHGYAVVDYQHLDPQLGTEKDFQSLHEALQRHGMGHILDVVPNHMSAAAGENAWWTDVLESGPSSPFAGYFDIEWQPVEENLQNKILLPLLGQQYGQALEAGQLKLEYCEGALRIRYFQTVLPLEPRTYHAILTHRLDELRAAPPADSKDLRELESVVTALEHLPEYTETAPARATERQREKDVIKDRLRKLTQRSPDITQFIQRNVEEFNGTPQDAHSFDLLDRLLDAQVYRLAHWRAAADEINYRRFFDINDLTALSMEEPEVFVEAHRFVLDLLMRGAADGVRIDHVDGLFDPREYLQRLQWGYLRALGRDVYEKLVESPPAGLGGSQGEAAEAPPAWGEVEPAFLQQVASSTGILPPLPNGLASAAGGGASRGAEAARLPLAGIPLYVVVEKILGPEEPLPTTWLVAGTTGYDFLNWVGGLFVDRAGLKDLTAVYGRFTGQTADVREVACQAKLLILRAAMSSELQLLAYRLDRISNRHRRTRDFTLNTLRVALREILACFPVYRTYIRGTFLSDRDRRIVHRAVAQAKRRNRDVDAAVFDFVRDVLLLEAPPDLDEAGRLERDMFVGRFQQVTSPVTAKGVEDTACYRYFPLASLNEVGNSLEQRDVSPEEFHRQNLARQAEWPRSLNCTTSHDTKRSEDLRARITVLSEIPHLWRKAVNQWARFNRRLLRDVDGQPAPSRNDEYLFYQTLVGVWPLTPPDKPGREQLVQRLQDYMEKATREAKVNTSWISPDADYDAAVHEFVAAALDDRRKNRFLIEFCRFHEQIVDWGLYTALSQVLLKLTSPGVPDIYQGQEVWDFSLVDPDNRRPVDYVQHGQWLEQLRRQAAAGPEALREQARQLARRPRDPLLKLWTTWRVLQFRRRHAALFRQGRYVPLEVRGAAEKHVCAFARLPAAAEEPLAVIIAPRLLAQLTHAITGAFTPQPPLGPTIWQDTHVLLGDLPATPRWHLFTGQEVAAEGGRISLATALADFPVAVLARPQLEMS